MPDSTAQFFLTEVATKFGVEWIHVGALAAFVLLLVNVLKAEFTWMGGKRLYLVVPGLALVFGLLFWDGLQRALVGSLLSSTVAILGWGTIRLFSPSNPPNPNK